MLNALAAILLAAAGVSPLPSVGPFTRLGVEQGLSNSTVLSICQDGDGCMWFATPNGLNRFDGYEVRTLNSSNSLLPDSITKISSDGAGNVLASTECGLYLYDISSEAVSEVGSTSGDEIINAIGTEGMNILYSTRREIILLHGGSADTLFRGRQAKALCRDGRRIVIGSSRGEISWCTEERMSETVRCPFKSWINCMTKDSGDWFWAGTEGDGLWHINIGTGQADRVDGLCSNYIRSMAKDIGGRLWIGTISGLNIMDIATGATETVTGDPFDAGSLPDNSIRSIFFDSSGGMWLGTWYAGAAYWHPDRAQFRIIRQSFRGNSLNDNVISRIVQSPDGSVWVGTNKGGLNHYDSASGKWTGYTFRPGGQPYSPESDNIKAIWCSPDGSTIYVGAHAGALHILDAHSGAVRVQSGIRDVYSIIRAGEDHLWMGSLRTLYLYSLRGGAAREYEGLRGRRILELHVDGGGNLWVGSKEGLYLYSVDKDFNLTPMLHDLTADITYAQCFHERSDMSVWIGTRDGLYTISRRDWKMRRYDTRDGMPDNWVYGIEEDNAGRLWISTGKGLWRLDPATGASKTYTAMDGLPSDQFTEYAHCRMRDGEMWFGGIGGIVTFSPEQIKTNIYIPAPVITGLYVDGEKVSPHRQDGVITLSHKQNSFTVRYSVPDYISAGQDRFSYTLSGLEKTWHDTRAHEAVFTHLGKGRYTFRLRAANRDGYWSPVVKTLDIRVIPPWYRTTLARIVLILALAAAAVSIAVMQIRQRDLRNRLEMEQLKRRHKDEISKYKALAFINSDVRGESAGVHKASISKADEALLLRAIDIAEQNIGNENFGVEDFAAALGMSRSNLHLRLKEITGESTLDLIHKVRFSRACELLSQGRLNIAEISAECGFKSPSYFTASFRKYMGCSPSEYASRES